MCRIPPMYFLHMQVNGKNEKVEIHRLHDQFLRLLQDDHKVTEICGIMCIGIDDGNAYSANLRRKFGVCTLHGLVSKFKDHYHQRVFPVLTLLYLLPEDGEALTVIELLSNIAA